ncbi:MAG TPA: GNAT family N-acetyltransferase [Verrucomicrobiales bacterium]|nr:GNAT family N-acetyltransferase [Verrucomicrobiales bacterium]
MNHPTPAVPSEVSLRRATLEDLPAIQELIPISCHGLQSQCYTREQIDAALGPVFAVDRQLILDQTYYVAEAPGELVGSAGWSRRRSLFGGDATRQGSDPLLDPSCEAARIRAFFIHPGWARRGIGRAFLALCESAIREAGFRRIDLVATLAGEPLYATHGFTPLSRFSIPLAGGVALPVVSMFKPLTGEAPPAS